MEKATLEFHDKDDLIMALKARDYRLALSEIHQTLFRAIRKHGYSDPALRKYNESDEAVEMVWEMERIFFQILESYEVDID